MSTGLTTLDLIILERLVAAGHRPVDLSHFTYEYRVSPKEITQSVEHLCLHGCVIEQDTHAIRMATTGLGVWADYLEHQQSEKFSRTIEVYQTTDSTQDLVKARAGEPLVVLADEQTGGRGRLGRRWYAPPGAGLLFSFTHDLSPDRPDTIDRISFLTAVAVAQAIENIARQANIQIRWPNDIYVDQQKLAGILVETVRPPGKSTATAVIGIGINVGLTHDQIVGMPPEFRSRVTSFATLGWQADRLYVADQVIKQVDLNLHTPHVPLLIDEWRARNLFRDQTIKLQSNGQTITGTVIDLDPDDGLIVRRDTGEITHLPAATTTVL